MRIAIFSDFFYPEQSGVTDSIMIFGKAMAKRGHSVLFVVPKYSKKNYAKVKSGSAANLPFEKNISVRRIISAPVPNSPNGQGRIALPFGRDVSAVKKFAPT